MGALADIKVIDLTQMLAGPYATMLLADHGAEVIKVEPPQGDGARQVPIFHDDDKERSLNNYFQSINRNKRSVVLDLKQEEGKQHLLRLIKDADVLVENFSTGVMKRLGLDYSLLAEVNPRLVYASLSGFGRLDTGASPYAKWPAFDVVAQAMGGVVSITAPEPGMVTKVGPGIGDIVPGVMLAFGILAAVHSARASGEGQIVDVAMVDGVLAVTERIVFQADCSGVAPAAEGNHHPVIAPMGLFPASDGVVSLATMQDHYFDRMCDALDCPELRETEAFATEPSRAKHRKALIAALSERTARFTKKQLQERLGGVVPFGPVMDAMEIMEDPHFAARSMIAEVEQPGSARPAKIAGVPVKLTGTPGAVRRRAPHLGEHNADYGISEVGAGSPAD